MPLASLQVETAAQTKPVARCEVFTSPASSPCSAEYKASKATPALPSEPRAPKALVNPCIAAYKASKATASLPCELHAPNPLVALCKAEFKAGKAIPAREFKRLATANSSQPSSPDYRAERARPDAVVPLKAHAYPSEQNLPVFPLAQDDASITLAAKTKPASLCELHPSSEPVIACSVEYPIADATLPVLPCELHLPSASAALCSLEYTTAEKTIPILPCESHAPSPPSLPCCAEYKADKAIPSLPYEWHAPNLPVAPSIPEFRAARATPALACEVFSTASGCQPNSPIEILPANRASPATEEPLAMPSNLSHLCALHSQDTSEIIVSGELIKPPDTLAVEQTVPTHQIQLNASTIIETVEPTVILSTPPIVPAIPLASKITFADTSRPDRKQEEPLSPKARSPRAAPRPRPGAIFRSSSLKQIPRIPTHRIKQVEDDNIDPELIKQLEQEFYDAVEVWSIPDNAFEGDAEVAELSDYEDDEEYDYVEEVTLEEAKEVQIENDDADDPLAARSPRLKRSKGRNSTSHIRPPKSKTPSPPSELRTSGSNTSLTLSIPSPLPPEPEPSALRARSQSSPPLPQTITMNQIIVDSPTNTNSTTSADTPSAPISPSPTSPVTALRSANLTTPRVTSPINTPPSPTSPQRNPTRSNSSSNVNGTKVVTYAIVNPSRYSAKAAESPRPNFAVPSTPGKAIRSLAMATATESPPSTKLASSAESISPRRRATTMPELSLESTPALNPRGTATVVSPGRAEMTR